MFKMGCSMARKILAPGSNSAGNNQDQVATCFSGSGTSSPSSSASASGGDNGKKPAAKGKAAGGENMSANSARPPQSSSELNDFSKLEDDPRLPLNVRQIFKITKSWKAIARTMSKTGTAMFLNLFEQNQDLFYLFDRFQHLKGRELHDSMELREHAATVMATLDSSINSLSDYDNFVTYLHSIGQLHRKVPGFKREYFWKIEQPFMKAVKQTLDERCNETIEEIYKIAIKLIIETIAEGYGEDSEESGDEGEGEGDGNGASGPARGNGDGGESGSRPAGDRPGQRSNNNNNDDGTGGSEGRGRSLASQGQGARTRQNQNQQTPNCCPMAAAAAASTAAAATRTPVGIANRSKTENNNMETEVVSERRRLHMKEARRVWANVVLAVQRRWRLFGCPFAASSPPSQEFKYNQNKSMSRAREAKSAKARGAQHHDCPDETQLILAACELMKTTTMLIDSCDESTATATATATATIARGHRLGAAKLMRWRSLLTNLSDSLIASHGPPGRVATAAARRCPMGVRRQEDGKDLNPNQRQDKEKKVRLEMGEEENGRELQVRAGAEANSSTRMAPRATRASDSLIKPTMGGGCQLAPPSAIAGPDERQVSARNNEQKITLCQLRHVDVSTATPKQQQQQQQQQEQQQQQQQEQHSQSKWACKVASDGPNARSDRGVSGGRQGGGKWANVGANAVRAAPRTRERSLADSSRPGEEGGAENERHDGAAARTCPCQDHSLALISARANSTRPQVTHLVISSPPVDPTTGGNLALCGPLDGDNEHVVRVSEEDAKREGGVTELRPITSGAAAVEQETQFKSMSSRSEISNLIARGSGDVREPQDSKIIEQEKSWATGTGTATTTKTTKTTRPLDPSPKQSRAAALLKEGETSAKRLLDDIQFITGNGGPSSGASASSDLIGLAKVILLINKLILTMASTSLGRALTKKNHHETTLTV